MKRSSQNSNRKMEYNDPQATVHIAVDVSKESLETLHPFDGPKSVKNTQASIRRWLKSIQNKTPNLLIVCEATGGYEQTLIGCCWELDCPVTRVNPRFIRHFAKGMGVLAKTDQIDTRIILEFAGAAKPHQIVPLHPPPPHQETLRELIDRRSGIQRMLQQEKNRLEKNPGTAVLRSIQTVIRCLQKQIESIDAQLHALQETSLAFDEQVKRLCQIKAIATNSAWHLLAHMPELGTLSDNQASALAGVAPFANDSGKHAGKRTIQHGRLPIRRTLYMCAVASIRHNPILRDFYKRLKLSGKPTKVALTAVMRKLIILCNRVLRDPNFVPA